MGFLWREISKDDVGIDGEIEVLTPKADGKGFQTTGGIIKVQAKSGGSYVSRDSDSSFAVSVKKEHLEYWNSCNFPVLFVIYHPRDGKLYCKEVKSYIQSTHGQNECRESPLLESIARRRWHGATLATVPTLPCREPLQQVERRLTAAGLVSRERTPRSNRATDHHGDRGDAQPCDLLGRFLARC